MTGSTISSISAAITAPPPSTEPPGPRPFRPGPRSPAWPLGHRPSCDRPSCALSRPEPIKLTVPSRVRRRAALLPRSGPGCHPWDPCNNVTCEDQRAGERTLCARAGRPPSQAGGAGRQGRGLRQEVCREAAPAAGRDTLAHRSDQSDRRGVAPHAGGGRGVEPCDNAQAVVAAGSLLVVAADVVQAANDKQQLAPMLGTIDPLPAELGRPETRLADSGYFSAANVTFCQAAEIEPLIAAGRQHHHPCLHERFAAAGPAPDHP